MLEIWAAIHPELSREWLENDELAKQALVPFRTNKYGDYHTARTSWHPEAFGYTYPETKRWEERYQTDGEFDEKKLDEELTILLNEKYNSAAQAAQRAELSQTKEAPKGKTITKTAAGVAADVTDIRSQIEGAKDVMGAAISAIPGGAKFVDKIPETIHTYDYVANVIYEKYYQNTPFF